MTNELKIAKATELTEHVVAVIDNVIHDIINPSRGGTRCVYGYYKKQAT